MSSGPILIKLIEQDTVVGEGGVGEAAHPIEGSRKSDGLRGTDTILMTENPRMGGSRVIEGNHPGESVVITNL